MRLKHFLSVFLTLLTLSVGQMWGVDADPYSVTASSGALSGWSGTVGSAYADGSVKFGTQGNNLSKTNIWSGIVSTNMTSIAVTVEYKINGTGSSNNVFTISAVNSSGTVIVSQTFAPTSTFKTSVNKTLTIPSNSAVTGLKLVYTTKSSGNVGLYSVSATASYTAASCSNKVTLSKGTATFDIDKSTGVALECCNGLTVTVSNITIPSGKQFSAITQTGINSGVTINNNAKTVTYAANSNGYSTIDIEFEDLPTYTVTLKDDNSTLPQASAGAAVTLPSRAGCTGYTFAGWTKSWTSAQSSWTTTAPTIIKAGSYTPQANENLYPVYTKETTGGAKTYTVTTTLTAGKTYVFGAVKAAASSTLANNTTFGAVAFTNTYNSTTGGTWGAKVDLTPNTSGVLTGNDTTNLTAACKWVLQSITNGNYTFKNGNNYLCLGTSAGSTNSAQCGVATTAGNFYLENVNSTCKDAFLCHPTSNSTNIMLYNTGNGYRMYASRSYSNTMTPYVRFYEYNPGVTISYISEPDCCTELGSIKGSFS